TLVALDKKTGAVRWRTQKEDYNISGYASAIVAEVGGVKQYIQFLGAGRRRPRSRRIPCRFPGRAGAKTRGHRGALVEGALAPAGARTSNSGWSPRGRGPPAVQ